MPCSCLHCRFALFLQAITADISWCYPQTTTLNSLLDWIDDLYWQCTLQHFHPDEVLFFTFILTLILVPLPMPPSTFPQPSPPHYQTYSFLAVSNPSLTKKCWLFISLSSKIAEALTYCWKKRTPYIFKWRVLFLSKSFWPVTWQHKTQG